MFFNKQKYWTMDTWHTLHQHLSDVPATFSS